MEFEEGGSTADAFRRFDAYDFARDDEFQAGLASILAGDPQTTPETIRMAKLFYYSRKFEPIDPTDYMAWREPPRPLTDAEIERALLTQDLSASMGPQMGHPAAVEDVDGATSGTAMSPRTNADDKAEMSYPATFAEIVELIKSGKPIPGIKEIPDKTAEGETSESKLQAKAKPWEQAEDAGTTTSQGTKSNSRKETQSELRRLGGMFKGDTIKRMSTAAQSFRTSSFKFPPRWPYSPSDFTRHDESVDTGFYAFPRLVNHIDDNAILNLRRYYLQNIESGSDVLDLASSWVSHLPDDLKLGLVVGIGLNRSELDANPRLTGGRIVKDLNEETAIPLEDESVDHVICNVSIDYLTKPREICLESARVLRPGGTLHLAISNRCFPTKVISRWLRISEEERLQLVAEYLHFAASEDGKKVLFKDIECVEVVKPFWNADPLNVIRGTRV